MRDPAHAAEIIAAMTRAVTIPVTVKMRKGWDEGAVNAPELARRVEGAGAAAIAVHGRTAKQSYTGLADWDLVAEVARSVSIPVFGSGDCVEPEQVVARMQSGVSGVFVGRGVLRNPWILSQARDLLAGRPKRAISVEERGQFLLDYMALLLNERVDEAHGFRHVAPGSGVHGTGDTPNADPARAGCITSTGVDSTSRPQGAKASGLRASRERWVINKLRALCGWYTKGFDGGAQLRTGINTTQSLGELHDLIASFFSAARPRWSPEDVPAIGR
jgi:tRNA-dihydrouridine synthase B